MIEAAETACGFVFGRTRGDLDTDRLLAFAIVRAIEIVGEAAGKVSTATRESAPGIPWPLIVSMRNRLIHAYFDVDHEFVWKTATEELPQLLPKLRTLVGGPGDG
jgi:uncharacterized protein with HEPN domain